MLSKQGDDLNFINSLDEVETERGDAGLDRGYTFAHSFLCYIMKGEGFDINRHSF